MKRLTFLVVFLSITWGGVSQNIVNGTVTDKEGIGIPGVTVLAKGTMNGTSTDFDGNFTLSVKDGTVLQFTSVGLKTVNYKYKKATQKGKILITMLEDTSVLEEVVVVGYGGKQSRSKVTNSIAKVKKESLTVGVFANPAQALSGSVSGVRVLQSSGNPGAAPTIILRGGTNFNGTGSPLIMVDGQLRSSLSDINPEDIESMDVLKDAGATALYGARASNGVILVTTKQGKAGKRSISFKSKVGLNYINNPYTFLGAKDYITWQRKAQSSTPWGGGGLNSGQPFGIGNRYGDNMRWNLMELTDENKFLLNKGWEQMTDPIDNTRQLIYKETDIAKYSFNNPSMTYDYNLNMTGGNDKGKYYAGLGYHKADGLPITSFYKRFSFILNGSYKVTNWLTSHSNFSYNRANWQSMPPTQTSEGNYFGRMQSLPPTIRFEDEEGNLRIGGRNASDGNQSYQPHLFIRDNQSDKFTMVQSLEAKFLEYFKIKASAQWYYDEGLYESFNKDYEWNPNQFVRSRRSSASFSRNYSQTYNATLNFKKIFNERHNIDVLVGTEFFDKYVRGFSASGQGAPTDDFQDLGLTDPGENKRSIDSNHSKYRILSYFGRANYDLDNKYLLSAVFRYDGYSSLLGDNRWGFFPGLSAGWIFSKEDFVAEALPFLSFGKLRTSYGINGNASTVGTYTLQGSYNPTKYNGRTGFLIGNLPNPALRWEKTRTFEVGLDFGLFENKLNTNLTFYDRLTDDKHASFKLPPTTGFSSITNNNGSFRNRGIELEVLGKVLQKGDFTWEIGGNISYNKNTIVSLPDNGLDRNRQGGTEIYTGRKITDESGNEIDEKIFVGGWQEGQEPGLLIGYKHEGLYKSDSDIPNGLIVETGNVRGSHQVSPDVYDAMTPAQQRRVIKLRAGDMAWKDINKDGKIDQFDRVVIGNTTPHYTGGFNTRFNYKGFSLYGRFDFALDFWTYDGKTPWFLGNMQGTFNTTTDVFNTWTPDNTNAKYPRYVWADQLGAGNYNRTSTLFAYKGDYLAFREVSLSYSIPKYVLKTLNIQDLNLSLTGQNLGYLTAAPISNPESGTTGYGLPRTFILGINVTF